MAGVSGLAPITAAAVRDWGGRVGPTTTKVQRSKVRAPKSPEPHCSGLRCLPLAALLTSPNLKLIAEADHAAINIKVARIECPIAGSGRAGNAYAREGPGQRQDG